MPRTMYLCDDVALRRAIWLLSQRAWFHNEARVIAEELMKAR
jgi:hypothetical protein